MAQPASQGQGDAPGVSRMNLSEILSCFRSIKSLSVPIGSDSSKPALIFTCESIKLERKSVGIFRIGILPEIVLCNVKMRLKNSPDPSIWAENFGSFLESGKPQNLKFLNLRIETGDNLNSICAEEAVIESVEKGIFLKKITLSGENLQKKYESAHVALRGVNSGHMKISGLGQVPIAINDASIAPTQKMTPRDPSEL